MRPCQVEDHAIPLPVPIEILAVVTHPPVRPDRSDHVDVSRAADACHVRSKRLRDLHRESAHASRRTVDQDPLPRPNPAFVPEALHGGLAGHGYGRRLLEREAHRLRYEVPLFAGYVLSKGSGAHAEYLIAGSKA